METLDPLVEDFLTVAGLAGMSIRRESIITQVLPPPHQPRSLPRLMQGVYAFLLGNRCLKVGKAGPLSSPRYTSQQYNPKSSKSNLARSILKSKHLLKKELQVELHPSIDSISDSNVGAWIQENTTRWNVLIGAEFEEYELSLLEAFVQCRLRPLFEGRTQ